MQEKRYEWRVSPSAPPSAIRQSSKLGSRSPGVNKVRGSVAFEPMLRLRRSTGVVLVAVGPSPVAGPAWRSTASIDAHYEPIIPGIYAIGDITGPCWRR